MTYLQNLIIAIADCNLHFCLYSAFGVVLMLRAILCREDHYPGESREHFTHGVVCFLLGLLR